MKGEIIHAIFLLILFGCFLSLVYIGITFKKEGTKCQANPLIYAANKLSEANGKDFIGSGYFKAENSPIIYFDRYNQTVTPAKQEVQAVYHNFTLSQDIFSTNGSQGTQMNRTS